MEHKFSEHRSGFAPEVSNYARNPPRLRFCPTPVASCWQKRLTDRSGPCRQGCDQQMLQLPVSKCFQRAMVSTLLASLLLIATPGAPSSFLFLVAMPGAPSSVLAPPIPYNCFPFANCSHAFTTKCTFVMRPLTMSV